MKKALIIDDDIPFTRFLEEIIEDMQYQVDIVTNANDAVKKLPVIGRYDIVILDLMMRRGDKIKADEASEIGTAIYKRLRQVDSTVPVLILTALGKEEIWRDFPFKTNVSYFGKPILSNESALVSTIKKSVERNEK